MENYSRLPKDFKFKPKTHYSVKFRRSEHRYIFLKSSNLYRHEIWSNKKLSDLSGYVTEKDILQSLNFYMGHDKNAKIEEYIKPVGEIDIDDEINEE